MTERLAKSKIKFSYNFAYVKFENYDVEKITEWICVYGMELYTLVGKAYEP